ncbi:alpha-L-rhamnosidase C-terminal domain-containing protein [Spirosoma telluris]|uniref:alpha-L-rhamnosidase-related protein n=1 Tax=Spirosoma telluris TaxID=2183553 RepID=UPI002FC2C0F5
MGFTCAASSQSPPAPQHLRCDLVLNTSAVSSKGMLSETTLEAARKQPADYQFARITSVQPAFSWEVDNRVAQVSAYRVLVASSPQLLAKNNADYWDSGQQQSLHSRAIYAGKPLVPGTVYYWQVQVWAEKGAQQPFSETASFYYGDPDPAELFAYYPLRADMQQPVLVKKTGTGTYFLDFGKDALGQLHLHLTSNVSDSIWIEVGEAIEKSYVIHTSPGRNIRYRKLALFVEKGTHDYPIHWPADLKRNSRNPVLMPNYIGEVYPFRYVALSNFTGQLDAKSVTRKMVYYPFDEQASSFTSSDTILNQVWELCKYSIKATSFTGYYVDGDRERIPYEADALINQLSHYAVDAEYSMARRSMTYLLYHPTWPTEWSLQNVLIAWNDYLYTGDDLLLKTYYPELQKKILMPLAGTDGLISTRTNKQTDEFLMSIHITKPFDGRRGLHDNVDWPQTGNYIGPEKEYGGETDGFVYRPYNAVVNAYYYRNLVLMQQIAQVLNKPEDAAFYERNARQVYDSFRAVFRDTKTGLIKDGDSTDHTSLHANMFALAFGLVPSEDLEPVKQFIKSRRMACSVYGSQFLLDALYDSGMSEYALELMTATTQRSWYNMIRTGSTITLEAWDKVYKPNLDLNHAWGAAPANIIVRKLMGVEPLRPGFERIQIKPQLGTLTSASLNILTIKGAISVNIKKSDAEFRMDVTLPGSTVTDVYIPANTTDYQLFVDAKRKSIEHKNGFYKITNVQPGKHTFRVKSN